MQQPEEPRYGGQPVSTPAYEEDDGITPGQVPQDQRVNSEYIDNGILSDEFLNDFDILINQNMSEPSVNNDYNNSVENFGDSENFESNDHNNFIDDNYEDYDEWFYGDRYDNCREETHAPNHNQGSENYDSFYDELNRSHTNAQLYDDHIKKKNSKSFPKTK